MGRALAGIQAPRGGIDPISQTEFGLSADGVSSLFKCTWNWTLAVSGCGFIVGLNDGLVGEEILREDFRVEATDRRADIRNAVGRIGVQFA